MNRSMCSWWKRAARTGWSSNGLLPLPENPGCTLHRPAPGKESTAAPARRSRASDSFGFAVPSRPYRKSLMMPGSIDKCNVRFVFEDPAAGPGSGKRPGFLRRLRCRSCRRMRGREPCKVQRVVNGRGSRTGENQGPRILLERSMEGRKRCPSTSTNMRKNLVNGVSVSKFGRRSGKNP